MKPGIRLRSAVCDTEVIVIKAGAENLVLECGGLPMIEAGMRPGQRSKLDPRLSGGSEVGKRYGDLSRDLEVLCVRSGAGTLALSGRPLPVISARPLPSAD
jgi:hypothetical protein